MKRSEITDLMMMSDPELWPHLDILPIKNPSRQLYGVLIDNEGHTIFVQRNMFELGIIKKSDPDVNMNPNITAMIEEGWIVD